VRSPVTHSSAGSATLGDPRSSASSSAARARGGPGRGRPEPPRARRARAQGQRRGGRALTWRRPQARRQAQIWWRGGWL
jgi:hypothetical protein